MTPHFGESEITRREALRSLGLLGLSTTAASAAALRVLGRRPRRRQGVCAGAPRRRLGRAGRMADDRVGQQQRVPGDAGGEREALGVSWLRRLQDVGQLPQRLRRRTEPLPGQQRPAREGSRVRAAEADRAVVPSDPGRLRGLRRLQVPERHPAGRPSRCSTGGPTRSERCSRPGWASSRRSASSPDSPASPPTPSRGSGVSTTPATSTPTKRTWPGSSRGAIGPARPSSTRCPTASCSSTTGSRPAGSRTRRSTDPIRPSIGVATTPTTPRTRPRSGTSQEAFGPKHLWWLGLREGDGRLRGPVRPHGQPQRLLLQAGAHRRRSPERGVQVRDAGCHRAHVSKATWTDGDNFSIEGLSDDQWNKVCDRIDFTFFSWAGDDMLDKPGYTQTREPDYSNQLMAMRQFGMGTRRGEYIYEGSPDNYTHDRRDHARRDATTSRTTGTSSTRRIRRVVTFPA